METAIEVHKKIEAKAAVKKKVTVGKMDHNQWARQGDIYIRKIDSITGKVELKSRQLAQGNTKGSRHIIVDSPHVKLFEGYSGKSINDFMKGPQIEAKSAFTITHPEHAHLTIPEGNYQITYQMDYARQARVRD